MEVKAKECDPVPTFTENYDLKIVLHEWDDYSSNFANLQSFQEIRRGKWQERQARQGLLNNRAAKLQKLRRLLRIVLLTFLVATTWDVFLLCLYPVDITSKSKSIDQGHSKRYETGIAEK